MHREKAFCSLQKYIPHHLLSRLVAMIANCRITIIKNWLIRLFINYYDVDMSIAASADLKNYANFNSFFTRSLRPEVRPIVEAKNAIISPVDGIINQMGNIREGKIFQAKGHRFDLMSLMGDQNRTESFEEGFYATFYLAPKDYHRVHMPFAGDLQEMIYVPGRLFSVNPCTARHIPDLFARNERVITIFKTEIGQMAIILVAAMLVGGIQTVWAGSITPHHPRRTRIWSYSEKTLSLKKGDEMGRFLYGSTVIVLFEKNSIHWEKHLSIDQEIKMGQKVGKVV